MFSWLAKSDKAQVQMDLGSDMEHEQLKLKDM